MSQTPSQSSHSYDEPKAPVKPLVMNPRRLFDPVEPTSSQEETSRLATHRIYTTIEEPEVSSHGDREHQGGHAPLHDSEPPSSEYPFGHDDEHTDESHPERTRPDSRVHFHDPTRRGSSSAGQSTSGGPAGQSTSGPSTSGPSTGTGTGIPSHSYFGERAGVGALGSGGWINNQAQASGSTSTSSSGREAVGMDNTISYR